MKVLLDTNAYTALFRGHAGVAARVRRAEQVLVSVVVAGELLFGFRNVTWVTADRFGRIAAALRQKGKPLPTNDIWIAAHAMESGADLLSFDGHFEHIDGIAWVRPDE